VIHSSCICLWIWELVWKFRARNCGLLKSVYQIRSDHISRSVVSDSLRPHESQHARPPCPSPTPGVHPDSRPLSHWCRPAISSSVFPFSSCPQSLPASESFPMSQLFAWGGQSTGVLIKRCNSFVSKFCGLQWSKLIHFLENLYHVVSLKNNLINSWTKF